MNIPLKYEDVVAQLEAERLRADVAVADCNDAEASGLKVGELLAKRTEERDAALAREAALREELERQDRILRASCPEHCSATSAVGTAQNYISKLEIELQSANERIERMKSNLDRSSTAAARIADKMASMFAEVALAPDYLLPGAVLTEVDTSKWFRWNGERTPINKYYLCDVVLKDGRVLFDQSPRDFDWSQAGGVFAARYGAKVLHPADPPRVPATCIEGFEP